MGSFRSVLRPGVIAASACFVCAVVVGCGRQPQRPRGPAAAPPGEPAAQNAPATSPLTEAGDGLIAIDGPGLIERIRKSGRKATLVNAWASWCGSCKRELPMLMELEDALRPEGVGLMLVSFDEPAAQSAAAQMLGALSQEASGFIVDGDLASFKRALNPAWKGAIPSTFLFDANGALRYFWPGPVLEHEIANIVSAFLAGQPLEGPTYVEPDAPPG